MFKSLDLTNIDWHYFIAPGAILIVALVAGVTLNRFVNKRIANKLTSEEHTIKNVFFRAVQGIPLFFCIVAGLYWIVNTVNIPASLQKIFSYVLFTINIYTLTRVTARTVSGVVDFQMEKSDEKLPKTSLLTNILTLIIYAMGIIIVLQYYGISIAPIITAMGVGGMAVALGLQDTLASIASGIFIIVSKPFRIDDYIRLSSGEEGRVTDITWRYTTIQSIAGNVIVIPNKNLSATVLTNYNLPYRDYTIKIPIGVAYDSDLAYVEKVTLEVANKVMADAVETSAIPPKVYFHTFADSSINFDVLLHSTRFDNQAALKHEFIKALTERYRKEGIDIPFPIRTVVNGTSS